MNNLSDNQKQWILIALVILIIGVVARSIKKKKEREEKLAQIQEHIASGTGGIGGVDSVQGTVSQVEPDEDYYPASDAKAIYNAGCNTLFGGWCWSGGDENTVINVLTRNVKTKAALSKLDSYFNQKYNSSLDAYFEGYFWQSEVQKIYKAINSLQ